MKTPKKRSLEQKVEDFLQDMQWLFECGNFERHVTFKDQDEDGKMCEIKYEEDYQRIYIKIYPNFKGETPYYQRKALLHELSHIFCIPMNLLNLDLLDGRFHTREEMKFAHERATSKIENILDGLLQGKYKYALQAYKRYLEP
jgi:hypothetical protein